MKLHYFLFTIQIPVQYHLGPNILCHFLCNSKYNIYILCSNILTHSIKYLKSKNFIAWLVIRKFGEKEHILIKSLCFKDYLTIKNSLSTNMEVDVATDNNTRDV